MEMGWIITAKCKFQPPVDSGPGSTSSSALLCLQEENISFLELRVAHSGLNRIGNFSLVQSKQICVIGLDVGILVFRKFQDIVGLFPDLNVGILVFRKGLFHLVKLGLFCPQ